MTAPVVCFACGRPAWQYEDGGPEIPPAGVCAAPRTPDCLAAVAAKKGRVE